MSLGDRQSRIDVLATCAVTALAALLRFWSLNDLGLTHFDEGAYAATGRWIATWGLEGWAFQAGQSPGLFPVLLGVAFLLFGVHDYVAVGVSAAAGSLTVGLLYAIGRRWLGRWAGLAAALFLSTCEYHLIYSRLALTDALFALFFWAAAAAFLTAFERGGLGWFAAAGALTALAWNTKYHGFLPLAVAAFWAVARRLAKRRRGEPIKRTPSNLSGVAVATGVTVLGMLPWVVAVEITLGWDGVLQGFWDHSGGRGGVIVTPPTTLAFYLIRWISAPLLALGTAGALLSLFRRRPAGSYFVLVTISVLVGALLYLSFPRLLLPAVVGLGLLGGGAVDELRRALPNRAGRLGLPALTVGVTLYGLLGALPVLGLKTDGYRRAADYLQALPGPVLTQMSKNFYFYGDKPFVEMRFQDQARLDWIARENRRVWIAYDPVVGKLPTVKSWIERRRANLKPLRRFRIEAYEPVFYQGFDPLAAGFVGADFGWIEVFVLTSD